MSTRPWRKARALLARQPEAIAALLDAHFAYLATENQRAGQLAKMLGCHPNTARAMLRGTGAGKEHYTAVILVCGLDAFLRASAPERRAA